MPPARIFIIKSYIVTENACDTVTKKSGPSRAHEPSQASMTTEDLIHSRDLLTSDNQNDSSGENDDAALAPPSVPEADKRREVVRSTEFLKLKR